MRESRLESAYRRAIYRVELSAPVEVRVGARSPELDAGLAALGVDGWAIVTADNPGSRRLPASENRRRRRALAGALDQAGWRHLPTRGIDPDGRWPPEPGWLVGDAPPAALIALAGRFGQAAILTGRAGAVAQLVWIEAAAQTPPESSLSRSSVITKEATPTGEPSTPKETR
jgi:hypothetical protein